MKKNWLIGLGIAVVIVWGLLVVYSLLTAGSFDTLYYTQIDNTKLSQAPHKGGPIDLSGNGGMEYSYTLPSYDKDGKQEDVTFGVSRELREGAFLCLTVRSAWGVISWAEVQYEDLPPAVQEQYPSMRTDP